MLISVEGKFADGMLDGTKRIEIRRRELRIEPNTRLWVYSKVPVGAVTAMVCLSGVERLSPSVIWDRYSDIIGISGSEFSAYARGAEKISVLHLTDARPVVGVGLSDIRSVRPAFQPPQFYMRLEKQENILSIFESGLKSKE
ncbi:hypothetical protein [Devosia sp.]|uniref:hypothetical protein n=1 Tax=Devosia sp. TaxID=1871048 RepID=UPI001AD38B0A|nr:hypothetical protein [Devosia sp.]MBN9310611.1 hypothetical protein [Devosia sp.]